MARAGRILTRQQRCIAFEQGAETPCAGSQQDQIGPGDFVDPITKAPLFRTDAKCRGSTGSRSFLQPVAVSVPAARRQVLGTRRFEVHGASPGIHLGPGVGHVFDDGPPRERKALLRQRKPVSVVATVATVARVGAAVDNRAWADLAGYIGYNGDRVCCRRRSPSEASPQTNEPWGWPRLIGGATKLRI